MTNPAVFNVLPYPRKVYCPKCQKLCGLEQKDGSGPYLSSCLRDGREGTHCEMSLSLVNNRPREFEGQEPHQRPRPSA